VYAEGEDDQTMYALEIPEAADGTCSFGLSYAHPPDGEPAAEDEELACDSQTFSTLGTTKTVVWIRNTGHTVFSYTVPGGRCPLPTFATYLAPAIVAAGGTTAFCASITVHYLEGYKSLPAGLPVQFSAGSQQLGVGYTTGGPDVCTSPVRESLPIGQFSVTASFAGTDAYLPSAGAGPLQVLGATAAQPQSLLLTGLLPGSAVPPGGTPPVAQASQLQSAQQGQAQAQSEAQAQAQTQSQAQVNTTTQLQPGMVMQRQKRTQIAVQEQGAAMNATHEAAALRRQPAAVSVVIAAGMLLLGLGMAARRPRVALARSLLRRQR
jgi:hypothetical protein